MTDADRLIFAWYAFNMMLTMLSLGVWALASLCIVFIHPTNVISWVMFINILLWIIYANKDDKSAKE
jgi:hypothetical protein